VLLILFLFFALNFVVGQELLDVGTRATVSQSRAAICPPFDYQPKDFSAACVDGATAGPWPRILVYNEFTWANGVADHSPVCCNCALRGYWLKRTERKSGECYRSAVFLNIVGKIRRQWLRLDGSTGEWILLQSTRRDVKFIAPPALRNLDHSQGKVCIRGIPTIDRSIYGLDITNRDASVSEYLFGHVSSGDNIAILSDEEARPLNGNEVDTFVGDSVAHADDRDDGLLHSLNSAAGKILATGARYDEKHGYAEQQRRSIFHGSILERPDLKVVMTCRLQIRPGIKDYQCYD